MNTLKIFSVLSLFLAITATSFAQKNVTETVPVSGNCGMCKTNIEKAAKKAGASKAEWDVEAKKLTVTYASASTDLTKIQRAVAEVGYDTRDVKATDAAYNKLHACCKYDRAAQSAAHSHCQVDCEMKDGKCLNMEQCKEKGCCTSEADCKDKGCCREKHDHASATDKEASCCAKSDGKTAGHDAKTCDKDCCKK